MVHHAKLEGLDLRPSGFAHSAFSHRAMMMNRLLALLVGGMLSGIQLACADNTVEAPLTVTSGYGVSGLVLWLAADSGVTLDKDNSGGVGILADKTGNFILTPNSADQEPIYVPNGLNGRPVLRFNGDQSLYSPDNFGTALNRDMTIIIVAMTTNSSLHRELFPLYLGQNSSPHVNRAFSYLKGKEVFQGQFVGCNGPPVVPNIFFVSGASINSKLTQATFYRNGKQTMVSNQDLVLNGDVAFGNLSDGVTMGAATDPVCGWQGDIAEELVYNRQLSPAEMQMVWSYLSAKYGLH
jgi:hypothetical protein